MINELSIIIECIAPSKKIQCSNSYAPWINDDFLRESKIKDNLHKIAKGTNNQEDWRKFRVQRNLVTKMNKTNKSKYYNYRLNINKNDTGDENRYQNDTQSKIMWETFKNLTNSNKQVPPRVISYNGNMVTSIKKIVNIANEFFIEKIQKIRESFSVNVNISAIEILQKLVPKCQNNFEIKMATVDDIARIIAKMKPKNSKGNDITNIKIIKKLCPAILPHITHLVNSIIYTEIYPTIFKVSRISPILKPDKQSEFIDSYRPINNLSAVEKIVEEFLKEQLNEFINQNEIILPDHHGSRKDYSTMTAISCLNHKLLNNYNDGLISAVIQTDLSAAFDTVDHETLLKKMEHYGIGGKMNNLLSSFLSNRYQYVSIDGIESEVVQSLPCSVIQGRKLSTLLYTIYINEVTVLHKLMGTDIYQKIRQEILPIKSEIIGHEIIQYVDDTNNIIYGNIMYLKQCYDVYVTLLVVFKGIFQEYI